MSQSPGKDVKVERTQKGNIPVKEEDLKLAWDFFDTKGIGKVTAADLKKRLSTFYKNVSTKEIKFLLNNQSEITFQELLSIVKDNQLGSFDPVKEAFKVYDPHDQGYVDMNKLKDFFRDLGYGEISEEDVKIIREKREQEN